ncbi:putative oxidoreductase [Histoplasma ohiense]|nr:putative oxidoreductase [Histoplasma ohiense (nom. inval.)]
MSLLTLTGKYGAWTNPFSSEHSPVDECRASLVLGLSGCLTGLSILIVVLRCYCRGQIERHYWYDDYVIFFATICSIIVLACFIGESHSGLGCYILFLSSEDREYLAKIGYIHEIFGLLGINAVKISVGFFMLRTISQVNIRNSAKAMIVFVLAFTVLTVSVLIFQCVPATTLWDSSLEPGSHCLSLKSYVTIGLVTDSVNAAIDLILSTLPLPLYYNSNSSKYSRVSLIGIVALAYIACSAAITKIVRRANLLAIPDSWRESDYTLWTSIELQIGVLATSLPTINPILTVILASIYKTFRTPKWPTSSPDTHDHISANRPIRMGSHSLRRQSRSTLNDHHASSITTQHSEPEQHHITRYPSSHYKVEVSASRQPSSQNDMRRDAILAAGRSGFPAIVRTTDVYIHTASGNKGEYEEDVENTSAEIPPAK